MNEKEQHAGSLNINDEFGETSKSILLNNTNLHLSENLDISHSVLEHNDSIRGTSDPVKYLDLQRMRIEQRNAMMVLKISAYEKALIERDHTIQSLHTEMINSQNDNYVLSYQYQNIMEKTKSISDTCIGLNTNFTSICERLNRLGDTVDNAKIRQKDVINLVDQTTNIFQQKILNITESIDDSLKQVNTEKIKVKQELEILKKNYSFEISAYKINLDECTTEIENLKSKNNAILDKCNESIIKLNEENETALRLNQHLEKELKDIENQNRLLTYDNTSINIKLDEILNENQTLKDEINLMKTSLDENKTQLSVQLNIVQEQKELLENLKKSVELKDMLEKDNLILKECNEHLEKLNHDIMEGINKSKLSQNEIQEEKETQFKEMCNNYDELLKMQEEKVIDLSQTLVLQKEKENKIQNQVNELQQKVHESNKKIVDLQEELKVKCVMIPDLQFEIDDLKTKLANTHDNLRVTARELSSQKNELEKDKQKLEIQNKDNFKQIEKLTANYMKYKSKAKLLYAEVMRLRFQCSRPNQKKSLPSDIIEIMSDNETNEDDDVSIIEFNDKDISNLDISVQSTSKKISLRSNCSNVKRNSSPLQYVDNSKVVKKQKTTANIVTPQEMTMYNPNLKENRILKSIDYNLSPQKEKLDQEYSIKSVSNSGPNPTNKNKFKKPSVKHQRKLKSTNIPNIECSKPNSPVILTPASSNIIYLENVFGSNC